MKSSAIVSKRSAALLAMVLCSVGVAYGQSAPSAYTKAYRYLDGGLLAGTISPAPSGQSNFLATRNTYDSKGRLQKVETGVLASWQSDQIAPANWTGFSITKVVTYTYDASGNKTKEVVTGYNGGTATTNVTQFAYDAHDRLTCTAVRMNPAAFSSLPSSACNLGSQGAAGPDRVTTNTYDSLNRVTQIRRAVGTSIEQAYVTYSYTADGLKQDIVDANGNHTRLTYDGHNRQNRWYFPSKTRPTAFDPANTATALASAGAYSTSDYEAYTYDNNGNRTSLRKRDGQTISYQYDALNRVTLKNVPGAANDVYYGYDLRGLQTFARFGSAAGQGITNVYDGFGRNTSSSINLGGTTRTIGRQFDAHGNRTRVTHPDSNYFVYNYDALDRLTSILENGSTTIASQTYHAMGLRHTQTRAGVSTTYAYDPALRLASWADNLAGSAADVTTSFTAYNPANQVVTRSRNNDTYAFTEYTSGNYNYSSNGLNQYTSVGGATLAYDDNGNLTSDDSTTYTYDIENRLTSASGARNATLSYDPLGRLFEISSGGNSTLFLYDGDELIAEYSGSGAILERYVHGRGIDDPLIWYEGGTVSSAARRALQADYQGSIISIADASGSAKSINRYDEYGIPSENNAGRFQYTGQVWLSELTLNYYKARFYDPRLGRFLQTDPIGYDDNLNLYAYVDNDPLNRMDPTGMYSCGESLSPGQCKDFTNAQNAAKERISAAVETLSGIQSKVNSGDKLTSAEQKVADRVSEVLGKGAGTDAKVLGSLIDTANKMMTVLDSDMPAEMGSGSSDYAHADSAQLTLFPSHFSSSVSQQVQTVAHESAHHGANTNDNPVYFGVQFVDAYGMSNARRMAELARNPAWMLRKSDPVTFALGFDRDDAWK